jgi:hypothetical protein
LAPASVNQQRKETTMTTSTTTKPAKTIRDGALKATIWKNAGEKGEFFSVRFSRTWKDEQGNLHDTDSFSGSELLRLSHLAAKAYEEVGVLRQPASGPESDGPQ